MVDVNVEYVCWSVYSVCVCVCQMKREKRGDEGDNKLRSLLLNDSDSPSGHPFSLSVLLICPCVC